MMESVYGQRFGQAQIDMIEAARALVGIFGVDRALLQSMETVSGQNERLRALFRLEATAAFFKAVAAQALGPVEGGGVMITEAGADMLVSLRAVLDTPNLTKTSRAAIIAAFGDPDDPQFGEEPAEGAQEPAQGEEPTEGAQEPTEGAQEPAQGEEPTEGAQEPTEGAQEPAQGEEV
jgi:hypothetical protein